MNFQSEKTSKRYGCIVFLMILVALAALSKAIYTMTFDRERWIRMSELLVRQDRPLPAKRGNILAADGQILAASLPEYQIYVDFMSYERDEDQRAKDQKRRDALLNDTCLDAACAGMHRIFPDIDPARLKAHLKEGRRLKSHYWPVYTSDVTRLPLRPGRNRLITYVEYSAVRQLPLFRVNSSVNFVKTDMRKRPFGDMACRTIGDFKDTARYGLELTFDSLLAGRPGRFHYQKVLNRKVPVVDEPAIDGCDVVTTLDVSMQQIVEQALGEKLKEINAVSGVCILMEVATGDVKAMSSLSRHEDGTYHEDRALAVTDLYEPGSVFKPQSFLVAFDDGMIKMTDAVNVGGGIYNFGERKMKDHNWRSGGYGVLTVPEIIGKSSNVGVSVLINEHYHDNPGKFVDGLYRIGSAEDLHFPLPGYMRPRIRRPGQGAYWSATTLPWMSIGYETQVTPINTLNFYNGIANNGRLLCPRLVKEVVRDGEVVKEYPVKVLREHMARPEAVKHIQECLEYVTTRGVGKAANSRYFPVAGKTGTAQIWGGSGRTSEYFITFAGYFPADKPRYSCIVCIRKPAPASGGGMCGPVFKRVAEAIMARNSMENYTAARDTTGQRSNFVCPGDLRATARLIASLGLPEPGRMSESNRPMWGTLQLQSGRVTMVPAQAVSECVPDVIGYGLRDAICRLEELGLRVKATGVGRVKAQSLPYGHTIRRGETITLTLGVSHREGLPVEALPATAPLTDSAGHLQPAPAEPQSKQKPKPQPADRPRPQPASGEKPKAKSLPAPKPAARSDVKAEKKNAAKPKAKKERDKAGSAGKPKPGSGDTAKDKPKSKSKTVKKPAEKQKAAKKKTKN